MRTHLETQLRLAFEGGAWHGPSVRDSLAGITALDAAARPIDGAHSIWEIVLHLGGAYRLVLRRLDGDDTQLTPTEDWPAVPAPTEVNWSATVSELAALNARIRAAVAAFPSDRLGEPLVPTPPYSAFTQFIGLTQHDLYHAGQIMLLRRAIENGLRA